MGQDKRQFSHENGRYKTTRRVPMILKRGLDEHVLQCFEQFRIDPNLPKHHKQPDPNTNDSEEGISVKRSRSFIMDSGPDTFSEKPAPHNWRERLVSWIAAKLGVWYATRTNTPITYGNQSPIEMFAYVRGSMAEAGKYAERMKTFQKKLTAARETGQTTLVETLEKSIEVIKAESILYAAGFTKFITEKQVVEFALKCKKGLRLDWIANYTGIVPEQVLKKKIEADQLKIFDNYLIMHYDPTGKAFGLTQQEQQAKRDPILFGVISGTRKLYFIADWVTKEDDLTLEEVAKVLGHNIDEITAESEA
jgi:hypothetical protein